MEGVGRGEGKVRIAVNTALMYEILTSYNWMDLQSTETNLQHIPLIKRQVKSYILHCLLFFKLYPNILQNQLKEWRIYFGSMF